MTAARFFACMLGTEGCHAPNPPMPPLYNIIPYSCWASVNLSVLYPSFPLPPNRKYPPPCISYANVHNYYGPCASCSLDKGVACAQHIQLLTHTCGGHMC